MADISVRGFDGDGGVSYGAGQDRVAPQPDFSNMTLEEIQAWEAAHNTNPVTGTLPASAVIPAHLDERTAALDAQEPEQQTGLSLVPPASEQQAYQPEQEPGPEESELIRAKFSMGEPFVHVIAYLTAGPLEIIATPQEALELYMNLGFALGAAQQAGVIA